MDSQPRTPISDGRVRRALCGTLALTVIAAFLGLSGVTSADENPTDENPTDKNPAGQNTADLGEGRTMVRELMQTQRLISEERSDWRNTRQTLKGEIELTRDAIQAIRAKIDRDAADIEKQRAREEELLAERQELDASTAAFSSRVRGLETRIKDLLPRLPGPLQDQVRPFSQEVPEDPENNELGLAKRFQTIIAILNAVNKFNGDVRLYDEVRELEGGRRAAVSEIYVGIATGYYVTEDRKVAAIGRVGEDGWTWKPTNEAAAEIGKAVDILNGDLLAEFVHLPIRID